MKLLVSDMGGILYSFDSAQDPMRHEEKFDEAMKELGLTDAPLKDQLEGEWRAVNSGLLKVYPPREGVENLLRNLQEWKLVIVSTSRVKTSDWILKKIGVKIDPFRIFDMSDYGGKKDPGAWQKVFEQLPGVEAIVEDGRENLRAAGEAARDLGFAPTLYSRMPKLVK